MTRKRYIITIKSCSECPFAIKGCNSPGRLGFVCHGIEGTFPVDCRLKTVDSLDTESAVEWREIGGVE